MLAVFSVIELVIGVVMLLAPRRVRRAVMPDHRRYEGRVFSATTPGTYRFAGFVFLRMACITGYALIQSIR